MRIVNFLSKLLTAATAIGLAIVGTAHAADLTVTIHHIRNTHGILSVAVYNSEQGFLESGAAVRSIDVKPEGEDTPVVFKDLPPGTYAVAAFHDENASGKFDTDFLGMPEEGYGFSNGAKAFLGPPKFQDAAVPVETEAKTALDLSY